MYTYLEEDGIGILFAKFLELGRDDFARSTPGGGVVNDDEGSAGALDGLVECCFAVDVHHGLELRRRRRRRC